MQINYNYNTVDIIVNFKLRIVTYTAIGGSERGQRGALPPWTWQYHFSRKQTGNHSQCFGLQKTNRQIEDNRK